MRKATVIIAFLQVCISSNAISQTKTLKYNTPVNSNIPGFFEYLPEEYATNPSKEFPLMIFMHGLGTKGDGSEGVLENVVNSGWGTPPYRAWRDLLPVSFDVNGTPMEFILITPQFLAEPYYTFTWDEDINALLSYCFDHYRVNHKKVYLCGQSAGGAYALNFVGSSDANSNKIAAVLASSPGGKSEFVATEEMANTISRANIPVWIAVNELDLSYPDDEGIFKRTADAWIDYLTNATPPPLYAPKYYVLPGEQSHGNAAAYLYSPYTIEDGINPYQWILQFERQAPLPVTISEFNAHSNGDFISLTWATQSESNNKGFDVQKSTDGVVFESIGFVPSKGKPASYHFNVNNQFNGLLYFRLQQTDLDGHTSLSNIASVRMSGTGGLVVAPNPVKNILKLQFNHVLNTATIQIFDNSGRLKKEVKANNQSQKQIDVSNLSKGFYTGRIISNGNAHSFTFVKE